jgi:hypothetical protein
MFQMHPLICPIWHTFDSRKLPKMLSKISYQGVNVEGATLISPCLAFSSWYFSLILNHLSCICFNVLYVLFKELGIEFPYELNPNSFCKGLVIILLIFFFAHVSTLALGSWPRQRACKDVSQEDPGESHHILPRVLESVREWTLTLPRQLPLWEMESRWTPETSESNYRGSNLNFLWRSLYHWKALEA